MKTVQIGQLVLVRDESVDDFNTKENHFVVYNCEPEPRKIFFGNIITNILKKPKVKRNRTFIHQGEKIS